MLRCSLLTHKQFTQIIDYYLSEGKEHLPEINRLAKEESKDSEDKLMRYCLEGFRLNGTFGSYREAQTDFLMTDETGDVNIKRGDIVFVGAVSDFSIVPQSSQL